MESVIYPKNLKELKDHILRSTPSIYIGSKTSTVIPYDQEEGKGGISWVNLSRIKGEIDLCGENAVRIRGNISWLEMKQFCQSNGFEILTSPTEESALVLSGLATSCTGERCFGHGTLRDQVVSLKYLNNRAEEVELLSSDPIEKVFDGGATLKNYQNDYKTYEKFKNAPYPRFEKAIDLHIGAEGQLGVITEAIINIRPIEDKFFLFIQLENWIDSFDKHLKIYEFVQSKRDHIYACELIDKSSLSVLEKKDCPVSTEKDLIFLEVRESMVEKVYEQLIQILPELNEEDIFQVPEKVCHELRMAIPRATFERNTQMGVVKKGTDVQVSGEHFKDLLNIYRDFANEGVSFNLFGHFGDAHLHFNFLPTLNEVSKCEELLFVLYGEVRQMKGSPFAEHGIGHLKKPFIQQFYGDNQKQLFRLLKEQFDPKNQFFPSGFMEYRA